MINEEKLVSIILPTYNSEDFILESINTVLNQTHQNFELIIIDDCSIDDTVKKIKSLKDKRIKLFELNENKGAANARNVGISKMKGFYLAFIDSDDLWNENKLKIQIDFMNNTNDCSFVYSSYELINEDGSTRNKIVYSKNKVDYKFLLKNTVISTPTVLIKKESFPNLYFEDIKTAEDYALWLKLLRTGNVAYGIKTPLVYVRKRTKSLSSNRINVMRNFYKVQTKYEKINRLSAFINLVFYAINALRKRNNLRGKSDDKKC